MAAPKLKSRTAQEEVKSLIAKMDRRGWTQYEIKEGLKDKGIDLSQGMISNYLKKIREEYREVMFLNRKEKVEEKLAQYREIRKEAWEAYDKSRENAEKEQEEFGLDGDMEGSEVRIKRILTTEGRLPDNAYLTTIMKTLESERALLGLDESKDRTVTLEECLALIGAFKDAARDVLGSHPDLLRAYQQRTIQIVPVPIEAK